MILARCCLVATFMAKGTFKQETATVITITSQKTAYTKLCGSGSI